MNKFTLLTKEQCLETLDILKKRGIKAAVTDFSILLGAYVSDSNHIDQDNSLEGRTGYYWTKTEDGKDTVYVVLADVRTIFKHILLRNGGARPVLSFSTMEAIPTNGEKGKRGKDGILEVEYGYYPQKAVAKDIQEKLERAYTSGEMKKTGNIYTTDSRKTDALEEKFRAKQQEEYEYNGKRYVRVEANARVYRKDIYTF